MFRALKESIKKHKKLSEEVKYMDFDELMKYRDSASRLTCDFLIERKFCVALAFVAEYYIFNSEIQKRTDEFFKKRTDEFLNGGR